MTELLNETPFECRRFILPNEDGIDTSILLLKGTFNIEPSIGVAEKQVSIQQSDEYFGEPKISSIRYPCEISFQKPGTDILLNGHAYAPERKEAKKIPVILSVAGFLKKVIVRGEREWITALGFKFKTPTKPFLKMPLVYEKAWGGTATSLKDEKKKKIDKRNPVGTGITKRFSDKKKDGMAVPNLEHPGFFKKGKFAVGFGAFGAGWKPRYEYGGTYDKNWQEERAPFLPKDFNPKFWNVAHPDLITNEYLKGGEQVQMMNMNPDGYLGFVLPKVDFETIYMFGEEEVMAELYFDTLLLEPDENRFTMLWKAVTVLDKKATKTDLIHIQATDSTIGWEEKEWKKISV